MGNLNCIDKWAVQMGIHNICLYKEADKKYTGYNLKTMELFDCALIGVCAVIRLNTVSTHSIHFYREIRIIPELSSYTLLNKSSFYFFLQVCLPVKDVG